MKPVRLLRSPLALYLILVVGLLLPNLVLCFSPYVGLMAGMAGVLLPLGLYMILLVLCRRPGKVVLRFFPLLLLINAFQLVLFTIFTGEIIAVDMLLNLFSASGDEAGELLGGLILPIAIVLLVHIALVWLATRSKRGEPLTLNQRRKAIRLGAGIMLLGGLPLWLAHHESPAYSFRAGLYPFNIFYNMYVAGGKLRQLAHYEETSEGFTYMARSDRAKDLREIYVFVLGETSRAYSWQLYGYDRETNPRLMERKEDLVIYKNVTTQSNTTYKSVPILLSPADAENAERLPKVKGMLTALKEAGFHTVFVSNQPANRSFLDFFAYEADEHFRIRDLIREKQGLMDRSPIYDTDMLPFLDTVLASEHRKLFIVLHAYGAHWSYRDRYPQSFAHFLPDDALGANAAERPKLTNAYDNAIRLTDHLLAEVIQKLESRNVVGAVYYTADHGEDVFDDARERILHSSPSISYYQLHVPSMLWLSKAYREAFPSAFSNAQGNADKAASSASNLHTLLELSGINSPELKPSRSLLSPKYKEPSTRYYLNDRYECVPLSEMLTTDEDLAMHKRMLGGKW